MTLRRENGVWRGTLPQPALRGIYPIQLRTARGGPVITDQDWFLRVFAAGALARPAFKEPEQVVTWWVKAVAHAQPDAVRPWRLLANDDREPALHRLFVVAYSSLGDTNPADRQGIWITAVRDGYHGLWRLLEATVQP